MVSFKLVVGNWVQGAARVVDILLLYLLLQLNDLFSGELVLVDDWEVGLDVRGENLLGVVRRVLDVWSLRKQIIDVDWLSCLLYPLPLLQLLKLVVVLL